MESQQDHRFVGYQLMGYQIYQILLPEVHAMKFFEHYWHQRDLHISDVDKSADKKDCISRGLC